ncbi:MAG TPA: SagB family peptide dehydrogenase [Planctomycetota bacterium]|nr:SagB family peptide dehydrogenase [Planctomycetota bacterium]
MDRPALVYHDLTKYTEESVRQGDGLDWSIQPAQTKEIVSSQRLSLRPFLNAPAQDAAPAAASGVGLLELSRLLRFGNGVTGMIRIQENAGQLLRSAPSAGALYPTEVYLAAGAVAGLAPGIYNYQVPTHELVRLWDGDQLGALRAACGGFAGFDGAPFCLVLTGIFWRSAWRYRERGYRRVLLDTGHVLGNLTAIGGHLNATVRPCLGFMDGEVNGLFFFDDATEAALAVVPVAPGLAPAAPGPLWASPARPLKLAAQALKEESDLRRSATVGLHRASACAEALAAAAGTGGAPAVSNRSIPLEEPAGLDERMPQAILRRRSGRVYTGAPIPLGALGRALGFAFGRGGGVAFGTREAGILRAFALAFSVDGLDPGIYAVEGAGEGLLPVSLGNRREEFFRCSLGQEITHTCAAALVLWAPAAASMDLFGDRAYRYLHLEAGEVGERFQLAATALGYGACGIGGFFDDDLAKLLDLPPSDLILYPVTLGQVNG